jgi:hypothetical protein
MKGESDVDLQIGHGIVTVSLTNCSIVRYSVLKTVENEELSVQNTIPEEVLVELAHICPLCKTDNQYRLAL